MDRGSRFGQASAEEAWKAREADELYTLRAAGVRVPKPVLFYEGVLLMELVVDAHGRPAPRLVETHLTRDLAAPLYADLREQAVRMLGCDLIHANLSPYNVLLGARGPVVIDFPQVVGAAHNSQAESFFQRDLENLRRFLRGDRSGPPVGRERRPRDLACVRPPRADARLRPERPGVSRVAAGGTSARARRASVLAPVPMGRHPRSRAAAGAERSLRSGAAARGAGRSTGGAAGSASFRGARKSRARRRAGSAPRGSWARGDPGRAAAARAAGNARGRAASGARCRAARRRGGPFGGWPQAAEAAAQAAVTSALGRARPRDERPNAQEGIRGKRENAAGPPRRREPHGGMTALLLRATSRLRALPRVRPGTRARTA